MRDSTLAELERFFEECPKCKAGPVNHVLVSEVSNRLGLAFTDDYSEFVTKYGGALVGAYPIIGLKLAEFMRNDFATIVEINEHFRKQRWPGIDNRVVFSFDQGGNPIAFDQAGTIWLVDHEYHQIVCIEPSFEAFVRRWCLKLEPPSQDYLAEDAWPKNPG